MAYCPSELGSDIDKTLISPAHILSPVRGSLARVEGVEPPQ